MRLRRFIKYNKVSILFTFFLYGCGKAPPLDTCSIKLDPPRGVCVLCATDNCNRVIKTIPEMVDYLANPYDQAIDYYNYCNQKKR